MLDKIRHNDIYNSIIDFKNNNSALSENFLNLISEPILIIDDNCIIKKANNSAKKKLNLKYSTDDDFNLFSFIKNESEKKKIKRNLSNLSNQKSFDSITFKASKKLSFEANMIILPDKDTSDKNYIVVLKTKNENEIYNKLDQLKSEFLSQMSHEIRTPINTLLCFSKLLESELKDKIDDELAISFEQINSAGKRLVTTMDKILKLAELNSGLYELKLTRFDLVEDVLTPLIPEITGITSNKFISFNIKVSAESAIVYADKYKVEEIIKLLVENAMKFTERGSITLEIKKTGKKVSLHVNDTGVGINEKYLNIMFEPFTQEEQGYSRKFDGNGIGLTIVKKYCELNNIELKVKTKKGEGSQFILIFNFVK